MSAPVDEGVWMSHHDAGNCRKQESYATALYDALIEGNIKPIAEGCQKIPLDKKLLVFSVSPLMSGNR